ncbi:MAG: prepilin-type N-terminal cleavage/methylation domain-containing protein [Candidatus Sumerlaeia bacterium]|nr:prepilin-type N-terminal cleavage/methylation domain-containing protein [Candidatus Sumerlaeia bacterium]
MIQRNPIAKTHGFTLIELLIVVAIIAILAAIAVPNFLAAQTRSKVSRVLSDLRTLRTAVESYAVDNNVVPRMTWGCRWVQDQSSTGSQLFGTLPNDITSPIQYISSQPFDPFAANTSASEDAKVYTYQAPDTHLFLFNSGGACPVPGMAGYVYLPGNASQVRNMRADFGKYALWSIGPAGPDQFDSVASGGLDTPFWMQYDPTNGTVSGGAIFVTQKTSQPEYFNPTRY